ncbi:hypothetical protein GUJ93_ZPchr0010g11224 [Zizania palustris]|uniref:Uncharacterized protein n=1 Tax=Zizania palustris TaxID=103762 RepID=A0A8J6BKT1_ZIZPA|nr:hypothetical protein GUJ93_ZPchr0010g11224 [Zizania palustris]
MQPPPPFHLNSTYVAFGSAGAEASTMKMMFDVKIEKSQQLLSIAIHTGSPTGSGGPPDRHRPKGWPHPCRLRRPLAAGHPVSLLRRRIPLRAASSGPSLDFPTSTDIVHNRSSHLRLPAMSSPPLWGRLPCFDCELLLRG